MLAIRRTKNPSSCTPPRKITKAPPVVSSIIVHDANSTSQTFYPFYPDLPENTLSCELEGLHYELRTTDLGLEVPYHLSLVQKNGDYNIVVNTI
jgi:hypothetical protein